MRNLSRLPNLGISVEAIGDWAGVQTFLDNLPRYLDSSAKWGQRKAAERLVKIVKGHMDAQDLGWEASTTASGDPRTLFDSGLYRQSIKTWQVSGTRLIGVKKDIYNRQGLPVWQYAALHEWKSFNGGPYRALWTPSVQEMGGPAGFKKIIETAIQNKIRRESP